jgi:hypothetical protein
MYNTPSLSVPPPPQSLHCRAQICKHLRSPGFDSKDRFRQGYIGWRNLESIPGLLKRLQIRALMEVPGGSIQQRPSMFFPIHSIIHPSIRREIITVSSNNLSTPASYYCVLLLAASPSLPTRSIQPGSSIQSLLTRQRPNSDFSIFSSIHSPPSFIGSIIHPSLQFVPQSWIYEFGYKEKIGQERGYSH